MAKANLDSKHLKVFAFIKILMLTLGLLFITLTVMKVTAAKFTKLKNQPMVVFNETVAEKTKALDCLTKNIYWEAAQEPFEGKVAVAQVTMNRLKDGRFGDDVCEVVYQKTVVVSKVICQFSWTCQGNQKMIVQSPAQYAESQKVAKMVLFENFRLPSMEKAIYFHADYLHPQWDKPRLTKIGRHVFYKENA